MSLDSLPNELLFDILREACAHHFPRCRLLRRQDREREYQSPLTISHVSQRLRHLALHSPFLWTCIHLSPESPSLGSLKLAELFLLRSHNLPISLTFVRKHKLQANDPLWSTLMASVQRWQDVAIYGIDPQDAITIPLRDALASASLPQMRSLIFEVDGAYPRDVDLTLTAPGLRVARFTRMVLAPESWQASCQKLSHLSIGHVMFDSWYDLVPLLAACKGSLQTLLLGPQVGFKEREEEFKVHLPQLRSLSVTRVGYGEVLKNLVVPSLAEFVIDVSAGEIVGNAESFGALLASVRRLKILDGTLPRSIKSLPQQFLRAFPNVEQLCLESRVASAVLSLSCSPNEPGHVGSHHGPNVWPALRELVIQDRDAGLPASYTEDLLKFIQTRTCEHPLTRVYSGNQSVAVALRATEGLKSSCHEFEEDLWKGPFIPEELLYEE